MIKALILTLIIETTILLILGFKSYKIYIICIITNIITNLSLNIILENVYFESFLLYAINVIILELFVLIIEAVVYYLYLKHIKKALFISLMLNSSSFLIGLLITFITNH